MTSFPNLVFFFLDLNYVVLVSELKKKKNTKQLLFIMYYLNLFNIFFFLQIQ